MQTLLSDFISAYILVGYAATAYIIFIFIISGKHIFRGVTKKLSTDDQIGYVLAMIIIMPVFYIFYLSEISQLNPDRSHNGSAV